MTITVMETSPTKTKDNIIENKDTTTEKDQKVDFDNCSLFNSFQVMDLFRCVFSQKGLQGFPPYESSSKQTAARSNDSTANITTAKSTVSNDIEICQKTPRTNASKGKRKVCKSMNKVNILLPQVKKKKEKNKKWLMMKFPYHHSLILTKKSINCLTLRNHQILDHLRRKNGASMTLSKIIWRMLLKVQR